MAALLGRLHYTLLRQCSPQPINKDGANQTDSGSELLLLEACEQDAYSRMEGMGMSDLEHSGAMFTIILAKTLSH